MIRAGYLLMASYAQAFISIQVQNTLIDYGGTDIDISCRVNGTSIKNIEVIQLKRSNTNIVSISNDSISWQDENLETRSKADGSTKDVLSSNLTFKIMACDVNQTVDERSYHCALIANGNENPLQLIQDDSNKVNLNITGSFEGKQEKCTEHSHAMIVKGSIFFFMKIALIRVMSY